MSIRACRFATYLEADETRRTENTTTVYAAFAEADKCQGQLLHLARAQCFGDDPIVSEHPASIFSHLRNEDCRQRYTSEGGGEVHESRRRLRTLAPKGGPHRDTHFSRWAGVGEVSNLDHEEYSQDNCKRCYLHMLERRHPN